MLNTKYYVSCDSSYMKFLEKAKAIEISCFLGTGIGTGMDWKQAWRTLWGWRMCSETGCLYNFMRLLYNLSNGRIGMNELLIWKWSTKKAINNIKSEKRKSIK